MSCCVMVSLCVGAIAFLLGIWIIFFSDVHMRILIHLLFTTVCKKKPRSQTSRSRLAVANLERSHVFQAKTHERSAVSLSSLYKA